MSAGQWPRDAVEHFDAEAAVANSETVPLFEVEVLRRHRWRQWEVWLSVGGRRWLLHRAWSERKAVTAAALETDFALRSLRSRGLL